MFVANFLEGPGTNHDPVNVKVSVLDYIVYLFSSKSFLIRIGNKYNKNFLSDFYFEGVKYYGK
tara:strand:- start:14441 stop:14629 length:189 start_codon:yes stop_codon:yes gene_type:complete